MASYKLPPPHIVGVDKTKLQDSIHQKIFLGAQEPTQVLIVSTSGYIDPITEELTYSDAPTWLSISGIVGSVEYGDMLIGQQSRITAEQGSIVAGTLKVSYEWAVISGIAYNDIQNVRLISQGVRGLYNVVTRTIDTFGGVPLFYDLALVPDRSGIQPITPVPLDTGPSSSQIINNDVGVMGIDR